MTKQWRTFEARAKEATMKVDGKELKGLLSNISLSTGGFGSIDFDPDPIDKAIRELRQNFVFSEFHEERVRKMLENDESLVDDLNHLVIAASLMISDAKEMKSGGLRSYEMGDKIIIEEEQDDGWQVVRTIGVQVAQILAHARAKKRVEELEDLVGGLGSDPMDRLDEFDGIPTIPSDNDPWGDDPAPNPLDSGPRWVGDSDIHMSTGMGSGKSQQEKLQDVQERVREEIAKHRDEPKAKIRDL